MIETAICFAISTAIDVDDDNLFQARHYTNRDGMNATIFHDQGDFFVMGRWGGKAEFVVLAA